MRRTLALCACIFWAACKPAPATLEVLPSSYRFMSTSDVLILNTRLSDRKGQVLLGRECVFVSTNSAVASVTQDGRVTANNTGTSEIHVGCSGLEASVPIQVTLSARLVLEARCETRCRVLKSGHLAIRLEGISATAKLSAQVMDNTGKIVPADIHFEVIDPDYRAGMRPLGVEVSRNGELRSNGTAGKYLILATAAGLVAKGSVEAVLPEVDVVTAQKTLCLSPGSLAWLHPKASQRSARGLKQIAGARLSYTSSNAKVLGVTEEGQLAALTEGTSNVIIVADSGAFAQVEVTVSNGKCVGHRRH